MDIRLRLIDGKSLKFSDINRVELSPLNISIYENELQDIQRFEREKVRDFAIE